MQGQVESKRDISLLMADAIRFLAADAVQGKLWSSWDANGNGRCCDCFI